MSEETTPTSIPLASLKDLDFDDIIKYALIQAIRAELEDMVKFSLAVETLESLLIDELDEEYFKKTEQKLIELEQKYGSRRDVDSIKLKEYYTFKFRELIKLLKKSTLHEVEGLA